MQKKKTNKLVSLLVMLGGIGSSIQGSCWEGGCYGGLFNFKPEPRPLQLTNIQSQDKNIINLMGFSGEIGQFKKIPGKILGEWGTSYELTINGQKFSLSYIGKYTLDNLSTQLSQMTDSFVFIKSQQEEFTQKTEIRDLFDQGITTLSLVKSDKCIFKRYRRWDESDIELQRSIDDNTVKYTRHDGTCYTKQVLSKKGRYIVFFGQLPEPYTYTGKEPYTRKPHSDAFSGWLRNPDGFDMIHYNILRELFDFNNYKVKPFYILFYLEPPERNWNWPWCLSCKDNFYLKQYVLCKADPTSILLRDDRETDHVIFVYLNDEGHFYILSKAFS